MTNSEKLYIKAAPEYCDLDTETDGERFVEEMIRRVAGARPDELVIDISDCFLDYWGCSKVIEGAINLVRDPEGKKVNVLALLTTMDFGMRKSYASLLFKGTSFERGSTDFLEVAHRACQETSLELKIWVIPPNDFVYSDLAALKQPKYILSSK